MAPCPDLGEDTGQPLDARVDRRRADRPVAEGETGGCGRPAPLGPDPLDPDADPLSTLDDRRLVEVRRQPGEDVQSRRGADRSELRQVSGQRREEDVAPFAVDRAQPSQVAVELAAGEEIGEGQLVDRRRAEVGGPLRERDPVGERRGNDEPAEPQARRQDLAGRAGVDDAVRAETLDRADRFAVVAELGVVVVLDDRPAAALGPGQERRPPLRREDAAGRVLVRGGHDDGIDIGGVEQVDAQPRLVDRDLDDLQPERPEVVAALPLGRVLDRDPPRAVLAAGPSPRA